jgi:succinoglycan biosynthesis protein ExoM
MEKIAITVCTYRRPAGLARLLASLGRMRLTCLDDRQITLVTVDNSPEGSAETAARTGQGRFALQYVHEPRKGLAYARNAALEAAFELGASRAAFIDDDEAAHPDWLESLHRALNASSDAAAALGPVLPVFETAPPPWLPVEAYAKQPRLSARTALEGYTCNALVALAPVHALGVRFDPRFNDTGGEDVAFFEALIAGGCELAWSEDALVYEFIPRERMRAGWLLRRWYRTGNSAAVAQAAPSASARASAFGRGVLRLGYGSARIAAAVPAALRGQPEAVIGSFYTACRGAGYIAGAFGSTYREYARPDYR